MEAELLHADGRTDRHDKANGRYCNFMNTLKNCLHALKWLQACKDHQRDPDFCVVARVEAFIAGWGLQEALTRAEAYRNAGADAILIHSKKSDPSDIKAFMSEWNSKVNSN